MPSAATRQLWWSQQMKQQHHTRKGGSMHRGRRQGNSNKGQTQRTVGTPTTRRPQPLLPPFPVTWCLRSSLSLCIRVHVLYFTTPTPVWSHSHAVRQGLAITGHQTTLRAQRTAVGHGAASGSVQQHTPGAQGQGCVGRGVWEGGWGSSKGVVRGEWNERQR